MGHVTRAFPMRARGAATGISALVLNIGTLIVSLLFPILSDALKYRMGLLNLRCNWYTCNAICY